MPLPTIYKACQPRDDVLKGTLVESEFAADLAQVLKGTAPLDYLNPVSFFANTHPTRGLKELLANVCHGLRGDGQQVSRIFRLDTNYGGGKTHALIALYHASKGKRNVPNFKEFLDPQLLPAIPAKVAAFDGENADPTNGRDMGEGIKAYTPWGEIAYQLKGAAGYKVVQKSDEQGVAPGAETLQTLFSNQPTLLLIDELSIYLRKLSKSSLQEAAKQLTAFLSVLCKAVESSPQTVLVLTLAIGKDKVATDAYARENKILLDALSEAESVISRKATLLDPTQEDETVQILRRRLFRTIDDDLAQQIVQSYSDLWRTYKDQLPKAVATSNYKEEFLNSYPLHPELMQTLTEKTSTLTNFQRVRGMLRLLAQTVSHLWKTKPKDTYAIHLWHIDPKVSTIRQEFLTKLGNSSFTAALKADVASTEEERNTPALAEQLDATSFAGMPPYTQAVAKTIFIHSLAFNEGLKGLSDSELRFSLLSPQMDASYIDIAKREFVKNSSYLDETPNRPTRFQTEANLNQIIRHQEQRVEPNEIRTHINEKINQLFTGKIFEYIPFPASPNELDDRATEKPLLAVLGYEAVDIAADDADKRIPELVVRLFTYKGVSEAPRIHRNNVVFLLAESNRIEDMKDRMRRCLALNDLCAPTRMQELAKHQQNSVREQHKKAQTEATIAIQQTYRHIYFPSKTDTPIDCPLRHDAIPLDRTSENPGDGQKQVVSILTNLGKLRQSHDYPDNPDFIASRTLLKNGSISTAALREEYRKNEALPILIGDDIFIKGLEQGIKKGNFVYANGDLLYGPGDPPSSLLIDENALIMTKEYAEDKGIWPRPVKTEEETPSPKADASEAPSLPTEDATPIQDNDTPSPQTEFSKEGILKEAFVRLWEEIRHAKVAVISEFHIEAVEMADALRLMPLVQAIRNADKTLTITGILETTHGAKLTLEYSGSIEEAQALRDYLSIQLRQSTSHSLEVAFGCLFPQGLDMNSNMPEAILDRLSKAAASTAHIRAKAKV